jgi:predicted peptidase
MSTFNHCTRSIAVLVALAATACLAQNDVQPPTRSPHYQRHDFKGKEGGTLSYWLMKPAMLEAGKKYPLVLALHGRGGNTEAASVLASEAMRRDYPCFVMAPASGRMAMWAVPTDFNRLRGEPLLPRALEALAAVIAEHPIDADRVYVTGQSMGGFGTYGALAASAQTFAAAMPICGGWNPSEAAKMKDVPLWIFHGAKDTTVPVERSRQMVEAIKAAGGQPKYTEYADLGHNSWSRAYAAPATWQWLFAQRRGK